MTGEILPLVIRFVPECHGRNLLRRVFEEMGVVIQRILDVMTEEVRVDDEARHGIDGDGLRRHPLRRRFGCVVVVVVVVVVPGSREA